MNKRVNILIFALIFSFSLPASSEHMYGAISIGNTSETDLSGLGQTASGMSYSVLFGFHLNKKFAYELGYSSLLSNATVANVTTKKTLRGIEVAGVASYPIDEQYSLFGRLGYANMDPSYSSGPLVETDVGFVYGVGAQYELSKQIGIRAGYNIYNFTSRSGDSIENNAYASVQYNF
jgi:OOP family OmpA-OmpF porin